MNKTICICFLLLALAVQLQAQTIQEKLEALLTARADEGKFNGSILVAQKGIILLEKGYGKKDVAAGTFDDANTIYQVGSVTKQFTAAVVLYLQEHKKLSVADKLSKYFPDFPQGDKITIENLLTHTSGIFNYTDSALLMKESSKPVTRDRMMTIFASKPLDFEPGTKWKYSNSAYSILGYIIEKVTGKPYEKVVHEVIFNPLGMTHSGFDFAHLQSPDKATGYYVLSKDMQKTASVVDSSLSYAAGAIYTTVGDLYKWDRAIHKNAVIGAASWQKAFTPYKQKYGYGWVIDSLFGKKIIAHGGGIDGFNSNITRIPEEDAVIIISII